MKKTIPSPMYRHGDKVKALDEKRTVKGYGKWNGLTYMYRFEDTDLSCGEMYMSYQPKDESKEVKEGGDLFTGGEWFVDAGDFDRLQEADEVYLRSIDGDETFDICNFGCDETGNAKENALIAAQSKNMYYALKDLLELAKKWSDGVMFPTLINAEETLKKANPNYLK